MHYEYLRYFRLKFPAKQYKYLSYFRLKFPAKQYGFLHYFRLKFNAKNTDFYAISAKKLTKENELKPYVYKTVHIPACFHVEIKAWVF
jgi:hypothetical protein